MKQVLPQRDFLDYIARQNKCDYAEAYAVWQRCWQHPEAYALIDTVLWIARIHELPVEDAIELVEGVNEQLSHQSS